MNVSIVDNAEESYTVTAITRQVKDTNRVSVYINKKYLFSLTLDQLLELGLKKGLTLTPAQIKEYTQLSSDGKLRTRALEWSMSRPRSQRELVDYLKRKGATDQLVKKICEEFVSKKYVDDERFALWLRDLRLYKNKSKRAIHAELLSKGVSLEVIKTVEAEQGDEKSDKDALYALIKKLQSRPRYTDQNKLVRYLLTKGFSYGDIKEALRDAGS